jgi:nucleoside-diphosphate-sugar epimerase
MGSVLVTGGTGFIGSYVVRRLLRRGDTVFAFDKEPDRNAMDLVLSPEEVGRVTPIRGDIRDAAHLFRTIKENNITEIVHLASLLIPACNDNPGLAVQIMGDAFVNVLEAARTFGIRRLVWASSVAVFGSPEDHTEEYVSNDAHHRPRTIYASLKSLEETLANYYFTAYGVDSIGFRFTAAYGVGRMRGVSAFATALMEKPALGQPSTALYGDDVVDWEYVEDAASMVIAALDAKSVETRVFNTQCDIRPVREVAAFVKRIIPNAQIEIQGGTTGIVWKCDDSLLRKELGFTPEWTMEKGCLATMNEFRRRAGLEPLDVGS